MTGARSLALRRPPSRRSRPAATTTSSRCVSAPRRSVILFHCYALTDRWTDEPLYAAFAPLNLGALGVQVFFVLSGFLVTQSWIARTDARARSPRRARCASTRARRRDGVHVAARRRDRLAAVARVPRLAAVTGDTSCGPPRASTSSTSLPGAFANNPIPVRQRLAVDPAGRAAALRRGRDRRRAGLLAATARVARRRRSCSSPPRSRGPTRCRSTPNMPVTRLLAFLFLLGSLACVWQRHLRLSLPAAALAVAMPIVDVNAARAGRPPVRPPAHLRRARRSPAIRRCACRGPRARARLLVRTVRLRVPDPAGDRWADARRRPAPLFAAVARVHARRVRASWHCSSRRALRLKSRFRSQGMPRR